jgi:hypothetical protein
VPRLFAPLLTAALLTASCGDTNVSQVSAPDPVRCDVSADPLSANVPFTASEVRVEVRADRDCLWTATSNAGWLTPSPLEGQGDATVTLAVAGNTQLNPRGGAVTINQNTVQVSQAPAPPPPPPPPPPCAYALSPPSRVFGDRGGVGTVELTTDSHCTWLAATATPWITLSSPSSGTGGTQLTYTVSRNFGRSSRIGSITIAGQLHIVVQSGLLDTRSSP